MDPADTISLKRARLIIGNKEIICDTSSPKENNIKTYMSKKNIDFNSIIVIGYILS